ncbi:bacterial low temperature requirement A protein-domain-containing protein [Cryomyces antarcticus]
MSITPTTDLGSHTHTPALSVGEEQHHHHHARRLRQFVHPHGHKVHIASSPAEAEELRRRLTDIEEKGFDLVIQGSPEHVEALRTTHSFHEEKRSALREQHGSVFDEFERVTRELDALSTELHFVSAHAVQLDANFSKYGYSAHLRTRDSPSASSANSLLGDPDEAHDWQDRSKGVSMRFWEKPIVRQYFHKGLLWRATEEQEVASYELFVDLLYVGIIAVSGDSAAEEATGQALLRFAITFIMGWKIWSDISLSISWFDSDDIVRRLSMLFWLACLLAYTTNIVEMGHDTYQPLITSYLAARLFSAVYYLWVALVLPMVRNVMISHAIMVIIPSAIWIASIYVEDPRRQALIWIAIVLDLFGVSAILIFQRDSALLPGKVRAWAKRTFDFYPGVNIEHKIERTGAFVTLVFGYSVVALLYQNRVPAPGSYNAFFGKAVLALIQAFAFNWMYFEVDSFNLHTHAIRRHFVSSLLWLTVHLPFIMSYVLAGAALSKLVLAHDCADADPETLSEAYVARSAPDISPGQRWFYCAGLAIALACMGLISLSHVHKQIPGQRIRKAHRLALRFAVALAILLLALAPLNSLHLIATTTALVALVTAFDLVGSTCVHDSFWWDRKRPCAYTARCKVSRKDLEASVKSGAVVDNGMRMWYLE